jgi:telomere length regulation protein
LNALVACAPRQAAPALIEEFFKNQYSVDQRYVLLNALALGARELASLPVLESRVPQNRTAFPSKALPPSQHAKYIAAGKADVQLVPLLMEDISRKALEHQKRPENSPALVREKVLRIKKSAGISAVARPDPLAVPAPPKRTTYTEVAAEYFIMPLINRFWLFLREEQMREERTAHIHGRSKYHGAGTGLVLNPMVLSQFLRTLGVLVNAGQNAPEWLAVVAPDALELAVTIGTRPVSQHEGKDEDGNGGEKEGDGREASVLSGALELALVVLDGALEVDGGRSLSLEHTHLLLGMNEWAGKVFGLLEKGVKVEGEGGVHEVKLKSVAAGVLLKADEITSRWKRSMVEYM